MPVEDLTFPEGSGGGISRPELLAVVSFPLWPPANGAVLRCTSLLRELGRKWSIRLVSPDPGQTDFDPASFGVDRFIPVKLSGEWTYYPGQYDPSPLVAAVRKEQEREPALAALLFMGSEFLANDIEDFPPSVADRIDCLTLGTWRQFLHAGGIREAASKLYELARVLLYERSVASTPFATVVVGEADQMCLERLVGTVRTTVISNGVEVGPDPGPQAENPHPTVVFSGVMDYAPNVDAVEYFSRSVWPLVRASCPDAHFRIAGRVPSPRVLALAKIPGIEVMGEVPLMGPVLSQGWVAVAPLRLGSGVPNKVLEAWAAGTPVVLTQLATNGIQATARFPALIQDSPEGMAKAIVRLLDRPQERDALGRAAYAEASRLSWGVAAGRVHRLLLDAVSDRYGTATDSAGSYPGL